MSSLKGRTVGAGGQRRKQAMSSAGGPSVGARAGNTANPAGQSDNSVNCEHYVGTVDINQKTMISAGGPSVGARAGSMVDQTAKSGNCEDNDGMVDINQNERSSVGGPSVGARAENLVDPAGQSGNCECGQSDNCEHKCEHNFATVDINQKVMNSAGGPSAGACAENKVNPDSQSCNCERGQSDNNCEHNCELNLATIDINQKAMSSAGGPSVGARAGNTANPAGQSEHKEHNFGTVAGNQYAPTGKYVSAKVDLFSEKPSTPQTANSKRKRNLSKSIENCVKKLKCANIIGASDVSDTELHMDSDNSETSLKKVVKQKATKTRKVQRAKRNILKSPMPANKLKVTKSKAIGTKIKESKTKPKKTGKENKEHFTPDQVDSASHNPPQIVTGEYIELNSASSEGLVSVLHKLANEMNKMSTSMEQLREDVNYKIEKVASDVNSKLEKVTVDIEKKLSHKFINVIDTRFQKEQVKSRKELEKEVQSAKEELNSDISCLQSQLDDLNAKPQLCRDLNLCILNHAQSNNENVNQIVSDLLSEGLKLTHIDFKRAERKSRNDNKPGIIIVTFNTYEDRETVLKNKSMLGNDFKYENVFITPDQSTETRNMNNNFKLLISRLGITDLKLRGTRLVMENDEGKPSAVQRNNNPHSNKIQPRHNSALNHPKQSQTGHNNPRSYRADSERGSASSGHNDNNPTMPRSVKSNNDRKYSSRNNRSSYDRNSSQRNDSGRFDNSRHQYDHEFRDRRDNRRSHGYRDNRNRRDYYRDHGDNQDHRNYRHNEDNQNRRNPRDFHEQREYRDNYDRRHDNIYYNYNH